MSLVHNEQTKLLANALDRASTACLTIGILAPIAAAIYSVSGAISFNAKIVLGGIVWSSIALVLLMSAMRVLRRLQ
jgi:hypothetical protein